MSPGATYLGQGKTRFLVWAPFCETIDVHFLAPQDRFVSLKKINRGYFHAEIDDAGPGALYFYRLDGLNEYPDPASRYQPEDVHGPSQVLDPSFTWEDRCWSGHLLEDYVIYELHVGTFTPEGTFEAIIPCLDELKELGITAIELMPVAQFPGSRNWGYDGVFPFAVQKSYGGPGALKKLVNACHLKGLSFILDVVYNHPGPEGNYLSMYGPYFTDRYKTPWGMALNFDAPYCDEVRHFFVENALYWITDFHVDALRLDAVHAIMDNSPVPFLQELGSTVHERSARLNRRVYVIPESAANDSRLIRSIELGGYGLDAQWNDDFHHAAHALLTGERTGYYEDYGEIRHLAKAYRDAYVYTGEYSPYRKCRHGSPARDIPASRFVVFAQNHDQVGNRMLGERLSGMVSFEALKLAAGLVILSPYIPLLFMGEEYGETAPFQYFISHLDPELVQAVRDGRREEFAAFKWETEPPDPQSESTFSAAKLNRALARDGRNKRLRELYRELLALRKAVPSLAILSKDFLDVMAFEKAGLVYLRRWSIDDQSITLFHFGKEPVELSLPFPSGNWRKRIDSSDGTWLGPGSAIPEKLTSDGGSTVQLRPQSFMLFLQGKGAVSW
ncbi:MAG: malto-oligosyltrehalose trehalohydrolase [Dehalococcoidia bacterium]|nr:malto-oligosyltrehalose trehalohydrolase [Dehalococcoidia bacterium]